MLNLSKVNDGNLEDYLYTKKHASMTAELYQKYNDLWELTKQRIMKSLNNEGLYYIVYSESTNIVGFAEIECENGPRAQINIGVLPELRRHGWGLEISKEIIKIAFRNANVQDIQWMCFEANEISQKIAAKLGGVYEGRNDLQEVVYYQITRDYFYDSDVLADG